MSRLDGAVAVSVSEPPERDLEERGLSKDHVRHAFIEVCRQVFARGGSIAYGGDLRRGGYTDTLLALLRTYSRADRPARQRVQQYLAWPVWTRMTDDEAESLAALTTVVEVPAVDPPDGRDGGSEARDYSAMREAMAKETAARVVLGGRTSGQVGRWPGVVEEAYLALRARQPLVVAGGIGGAADCVARALRGDWPAELTAHFQATRTRGHDALAAAGVGPDEAEVRRVLLGANPRDGLDQSARHALHGTADLDLLVSLVLRSLVRVGA
jgi:hypothetical protein